MVLVLISGMLEGEEEISMKFIFLFLKMTKFGHNIYSLDFAKTGSFEEFKIGAK